MKPEDKKDAWRIAVAIAFICISFAVVIIFGGSGEKEQERAPAPQSAVKLLHQQHQTLTPWEELILAIAFTESRFRPDAVGSSGDSGVLQITTPYVNEINRLYGTSYTIEDAFDVDKSLEMFELLQGCYNPNRNIDSAIYFHNKSAAYRKAVLENLEMIKRYEEVRQRTLSKHQQGK